MRVFDFVGKEVWIFYCSFFKSYIQNDRNKIESKIIINRKYLSEVNRNWLQILREKQFSWIWGTNLDFLGFLARPLNVSFQSKKAFFRWPLQQIIPTWWTTKSTRTTTEKKCFIARFYKIKEKVRCSLVFLFLFFSYA